MRLLIDDEGLPVLVTDEPVEPLTDANVRDAIDAVREERTHPWA